MKSGEEENAQSNCILILYTIRWSVKHAYKSDLRSVFCEDLQLFSVTMKLMWWINKTLLAQSGEAKAEVRRKKPTDWHEWTRMINNNVGLLQARSERWPWRIRSLLKMLASQKLRSSARRSVTTPPPPPPPLSRALTSTYGQVLTWGVKELQPRVTFLWS